MWLYNNVRCFWEQKLFFQLGADTDFMMDKILTPAFHWDGFSITNYFSLLHDLASPASVDSPQEGTFDNHHKQIPDSEEKWPVAPRNFREKEICPF